MQWVQPNADGSNLRFVEDDGEEGRGRPNVAGELTSAHSGLPTTPGAPVQGVAIAEGVVQRCASRLDCVG